MLILAEKPAVAQDFANALGAQKNYGFHANGSTVITWCIGHLFRLHDPEFYDERFRSWKEYPCIPETFRYAVNESVKEQSHIVTDLLKEHAGDEILIATDADREGEIIARECLSAAGITSFSRIKRFWVSQALTKEVILEGIKNARPLDEYNHLAEQGFARQHADWLCGMNFTRLVSVSAGRKLSVGRVKTALLSAVEKRDSDIENFTSEKYFEFYGIFDGIRGKFEDADGNTKFSDDRIFNELEKDTGLTAAITEKKTEKKTVTAPRLYSLNDIQKDAFRTFSLKADETLSVIQKLYETYKCVSYPRTPSKVMGSGNVALVREIFSSFAEKSETFRSAFEISDISPANKNCFNDALLEAHHALIPLKELPQEADERERKIYSLILNRFRIAFCPPYIYEKTVLRLSVNGHIYRITGTKPLDYGWKKFDESETFRSGKEKADSGNNEEKDEEQNLENIRTENLILSEMKKAEKYTKPPASYNEASIIAFMENPKSLDEANGKLTGLGTPATRHSFIPELAKDGYLETGKSIKVTPLGRTVINAIRNSPLKNLSGIEETTNWEKKLEENPKAFEAEIKDFVRTAVKREFEISLPEDEGALRCPFCKKAMRHGTTKLGSGNYFCTGFSQGCTFRIFDDFGGKKLSEKDVRLLVQGKKTPQKKFISRNTGKEFHASLYLDEEGKVRYDFKN